MLAYNLSPSFSWDTTGMSDDEMRDFPEELAKLGFVFNFITYGGHQIDGMVGEQFAASLREEGMLALAKLQRRLRLVDSPYRTPQTLVGGPRLDAALMASTGRTATTRAMGKGSTQFQHLVQTEVPTRLLEGWLERWAAHHDLGSARGAVAPLGGGLGDPRTRHPRRRRETGRQGAGQHHLHGAAGPPGPVDPVGPRSEHARAGDAAQTPDDAGAPVPHPALRGHVGSTTSRPPTTTVTRRWRMCHQGLFASVTDEVGEIIVADVDAATVATLTDDPEELGKLISRARPGSAERSEI